MTYSKFNKEKIVNLDMWTTRKKVMIGSIVAIIVIGVVSSGSSTPEIAEPAVALPVTTTTPPTTAPPVTEPPVTAPPTTLPPMTAPPVTAPPAFEFCGLSGPGISPTTKLSNLETDWSDEYCKAFAYGYTNIRSSDDACSEFWGSEDEDILSMFMSNVGSNYEEAVGLIDALWTVC
jgi:hypothetical protein